MQVQSNKKFPSHRVFAVTERGKHKKPMWREIGAAWAHEDGKGFSMKLDFLPLNDADIVMRLDEPKTDQAEQAEGDASTGGQQ